MDSRTNTDQEGVRCPKCEDYDYPGVNHAIGCPVVAVTREEIATVVLLCRSLLAAHERRNPTSGRATLGEEEALFNLKWELNHGAISKRARHDQ